MFVLLRRTLDTGPKACLTFALVVVSLSWTTTTVVVDAEQLLQSALVAEQLRKPQPGDAMTARFVPSGSGESFTVVGDFRVAVASGSVASATPLAVATAYLATPFGARLSLSMEPVTTFRAAHAGELADRVINHEEDGVLLLNMSVPEGDLRGVDLTLDAETHEVVREVLVFPRIGRVELERQSRTVPSLVPSRRPGILGSPASPSPAGDALDKAELRARLVLGQSGLDMRGQIHVSRTDEAIRVESTSIPPDQLNRLAARLHAIQLVQVDFHSAAFAAGTPTVNVSSIVMPADPRLGLRTWLMRSFKDPGTRNSFFPQLTQSFTIVHQRVALLADLAQRYPAPHSTLSASARPMFQQLLDLHYRRLRIELNDARVWVSPLAGSVHVVSDAPEMPASLVTRAPAVLGRISTFEQLLTTSLRHNDLSATDQQRINAEFADLWQTIYGAPARH